MSEPKPYEYKELKHGVENSNEAGAGRDDQGGAGDAVSAGSALGAGAPAPEPAPEQAPAPAGVGDGVAQAASEKPEEQPAGAAEGEAQPAQAPLIWLQCPACTCSVFKIAHHPQPGGMLKPRAFVCASCGNTIQLHYPDDPASPPLSSGE